MHTVLYCTTVKKKGTYFWVCTRRLGKFRYATHIIITSLKLAWNGNLLLFSNCILLVLLWIIHPWICLVFYCFFKLKYHNAIFQWNNRLLFGGLCQLSCFFLLLQTFTHLYITKQKKRSGATFVPFQITALNPKPVAKMSSGCLSVPQSLVIVSRVGAPQHGGWSNPWWWRRSNSSSCSPE